MNEALPQTLQHALDLSRRMLAASAKDDWDLVQSIQIELDQAVRAAGTPTAPTRHAFDTLAGQHLEVTRRAALARHDIEARLSKQTYNQRALHAYLEPQR